jgi:hypothetical protein
LNSASFSWMKNKASMPRSISCSENKQTAKSKYASCVEFYIYTLFSSLWNWYEKINYLLHEVICNEVYSAKTAWDRASMQIRSVNTWLVDFEIEYKVEIKLLNHALWTSYDALTFGLLILLISIY